MAYDLTTDERKRGLLSYEAGALDVTDTDSNTPLHGLMKIGAPVYGALTADDIDTYDLGYLNAGSYNLKVDSFQWDSTSNVWLGSFSYTLYSESGEQFNAQSGQAVNFLLLGKTRLFLSVQYADTELVQYEANISIGSDTASPTVLTHEFSSVAAGAYSDLPPLKLEVITSDGQILKSGSVAISVGETNFFAPVVEGVLLIDQNIIEDNPFTLSTVLPDASGVTISDVIAQLRHIVGLETLEDRQAKNADYDNSGDISISDVISSLRTIVGLNPQPSSRLIDINGNSTFSISNPPEELYLSTPGDVDSSWEHSKLTTEKQITSSVEVTSALSIASKTVSVASDFIVEFDKDVIRGTGEITLSDSAGNTIYKLSDLDEVIVDGGTARFNLASDLPGNTSGITIHFSEGAFQTASSKQMVTAFDFDGNDAFNTGDIIYAKPVNPNSNNAGAGTSTDPYLSLGKAATAASAGDTVYVLDPDSLNVRDFSYTLSSDVLGAAGQEIYIKPAPSATGVVEFIGQNNWILDGAQHVVIEGFNFDGNSDSLSVEDMLATGYWDQTANDTLGGIAINIKAANYVSVRDNYFHDLYQKAVNIQDGRYVNVWGNIIENVATRSLSGGHGIMRQQNYGNFGTDESGVYRWDLSGNLIFNTYQSIYSWVPSKGYLNMTLDEGKPILIDEPTNFNSQVMTARISENIIAYADVDAIRIKSTPGLEVSNNSIYSEGSHADGITDRDTTGGTAFPNFSLLNNLVQTATGTQAIELDDAIADNDYTISGNLVSGGTATSGITGVDSTSSDLFTDPSTGDFSAAVTTTAGVSSATLADLARQVSKWSVNVAPDNHVIDEKYFIQIMLDNIPGIRDGDPADGTIFDTLGTYADSNLESGQKAFNFEFADGAGNLIDIGSKTSTEITLPLVYSNWYDALAREYSSQSYSLIRSGHTYLAQKQVFGSGDLLAFDLEKATGYEQMRAASTAAVDVTLDGDLLLDFSNYSGTLAFDQTFDLIVADNITGSFDEVLTKGLDSFRIETSLQTNASGDDQYVAKLVPLPPGFTVSTSSVEVREGATTTFTVVLDAPPTEDVTLLLTTSDATASSLSASSVVFTSSNWNTAQTVTLVGVQDAIDDGTQSSQITIAVDDANSDNDFDSLADKTISVNTIDDDTAGVVLSTASLTLKEGEANASFTLKLASKPTSDVVIDLSSSDTTEVTLSSSSVTFTPDNWDQIQTITVSPVDDSLIDGSIESAIQISINDAASDNVYDPLANKSIAVTVEDNETAVDLTFASYDRTANSVGDVIATYTGYGYGEEVTLGSTHFALDTTNGEVSLTAAGASALAAGTLSTLGIRNGADSDYLVFDSAAITDDVRIRAEANSGNGAADTASINEIDKGVIRSAYFRAETDTLNLSETDTLFDAAIELTLNASNSNSDGSFQTSDLSFVRWDDTDWAENDALTTLAYATSDAEYTSLSKLNLFSGSIDKTNTNATKYRLAYDISNAWDTTNPAALSFALFNSDTNRYQVHFSESSDAPSLEFTYRSDDLLVTSDDNLSVQEGTNSIGSPINLLDNDVLRGGLAGTKQLASINGKNWSQLTDSEHQLFTDELDFKELDVTGGTLYAKRDGRVFFEHDGTDLKSDLTESISYTFTAAIDEDGDGSSGLTLNSSQGALHLTIEAGNQAPELSLHVLDLVYNGTTWVSQGSSTSARNGVDISSTDTLTIAEFSISDSDSADTHTTVWRSGSAPLTSTGNDFYSLGNGVVTLTAAGKTAVANGEALPTVDLVTRDSSGSINALSTASATPHATAASGSVYYLDQSVATEGVNSTYSSLKELQKVVTLQGGDTVYLVGEHTNPNYQSSFSFDGSDPAAVADARIWGGEPEITLNIKDVYGEPDNPVVFRPFNDQTILKGDGPSIIQVKSSAFVNVEGFNVKGMVQTDPTSSDGISLDSAVQLQMLYRKPVGDGQQGDHLHYTDGTYNYYFRVYYDAAVEAGLTKPEAADIWTYDELHTHHNNYDAGTLDASKTDKVDQPFFLIDGNVQRTSIIDTKGINVHSSYGVTVSDNTVMGMPGTGIQSAAGGAFLSYFNNYVSDSSRLSFTGTHGMQFYYPGNTPPAMDSIMTASDAGYTGSSTDDQAAALMTSQNTVDGKVYMLRIEGNEVLRCYNGQFSWNANKQFIEPLLDEGKGISIQFANEKDGLAAWTTDTTARILIADNMTYLNGLAGIQNHDSDRVDMLENVVFLNSIYSSLGDQRVTSQIGLFHQGGDDPTIGGNVVVVDDGTPNSDFEPIGASFSGNDADTAVQQTNNDADLVWALDGEVKESTSGSYSDLSDLTMDPVLNLDNLDFTPIVGSNTYLEDVRFTEDSRIFLQIKSAEDHSELIADNFNMSLSGTMVVDCSQISGDPSGRYILAKAADINGEIDTAAYVGLDAETSPQLSIIEFGTYDALVLDII